LAYFQSRLQRIIDSDQHLGELTGYDSTQAPCASVYRSPPLSLL
jgi:hypothetical protein